MSKKKQPTYRLPPGRYRFGGIMGKVEKLVVDKLGGPTKALARLVAFYLKYKHLEEEEQQKLKKLIERI